MFSANSGPAAARLRLAPFGSFAAVTPFAGANVTPPCDCRQPARRYQQFILPVDRELPI
jgi:hypothetical protein